MTLAGNWKKCFREIDVLKGRLEIGDVALEFRLPGIDNRPNPGRFGGGRHALALVQLGIKFGETSAIDAAGERVAARSDRPPLESAQALEDILGPADRFAELTVAHDVDSGLGLLACDVGDAGRYACLVSGLVKRLARLLCAQEFLQRRGSVRLPTCVVKMRSLLRFITFPVAERVSQCVGRLEPVGASSHLTNWRFRPSLL